MANSSAKDLVTKKYLDTRLDEQDRKWDKKLSKGLQKQKDEIVKEISDFLNERLLPLLDKQDKRIEQNELLLRKHEDHLDNHEQRILAVERKATWNN